MDFEKIFISGLIGFIFLMGILALIAMFIENPFAFSIVIGGVLICIGLIFGIGYAMTEINWHNVLKKIKSIKITIEKE
jgi:hypothetical protein